MQNPDNGIFAQAETGAVAIIETNFPDSVFREYVGKFDQNHDGQLSQNEIDSIITIEVNNLGIKSLEGIGYFKELKYLYCYNTQITSLDVSGNPKLWELWCQRTQITSLDVSSNPQLRRLYCHQTGLTSLDVSSSPLLNDLWCYETGITSLNVNSNSGLKELFCNKTEITSLDVSSNPQLQKLHCDNTQITSLDVGSNPQLQTLYCNNTGLTSLDVGSNPQLEDLQCSYTAITNLDLGNNPQLQKLNCSYTGLTSLDVGKNTELSSLACYYTGITSLDVSKNTKLSRLDCYNTGITSLDLGNNPQLKNLNCYNTGITSLDVSKNTALDMLFCERNSLTWLNIGDCKGSVVNYSNTVIDLGVSEDSFQIKEKFAGIDVSKISIVSGAVLDQSTGIVSGYSYDTPVIYDYDCGTLNGGKKTLRVTVTISKQESTIIINKNPDKTYDSAAVSVEAGDCTVTGSDGEITFTYFKLLSDGKWEKLASAPADAGTYKVEAKVAASDRFQEAVSEKQFTISQAANSWTENLSITGWTYGAYDKNKNTPTAAAKYGTTVFTYSGQEDGGYASEVPAAAGTWYVKAEVAETDNYTGLSGVVESFVIQKAVAPAVVVPYNLSAVQGDTLSTVALPQGWTWVSENEAVAMKNTGYAARFAVDDANYDFTGVEGYDAQGHYVERILTVTVSQGQNTWSVRPEISGWTYNQTAGTPVGTASHGAVAFTYSSSPTDGFTDEVPATAGTWYMKASVEASEEYTGLNEIVEFTISKALPAYSIPTDLSVAYGQTLKAAVLPEGYAWADDTQSFGNSGTHMCKAVYTPDDTANYEVVHDIDIPVTVRQAENAWTGQLSVTGWTYGNQPVKPAADAKFGNIIYIYSNKKDGTYTADVPAVAGTWYVKAAVEETGEYNGLESDAVSFIIEPKAYEEGGSIMISEISKAEDVKNIVIKDGSKELVKDQDFIITTQKDGNKETVTILFRGNYTGIVNRSYQIIHESYKPDHTVHYGAVNIPVTVRQAENAWTGQLSVTGWTYGDQPVNPSAAAKFGNAVYIYSDKKDGTYTADVPAAASTWYVKAVVEETGEYTGLESGAVSFIIEPKAYKEGGSILISEISKVEDVKNIVIKDGSKELVKDQDYLVTTQKDGNKETVAIVFRGNYTGTVSRSYQTAEEEPEKADASANAVNTENPVLINNQAKASQSGTKLKVSWSRVSGAQGYDIYAGKCGSSLKLVKSVKGTGKASQTISKTGKNKIRDKASYKIQIRAYRVVDGKKKTIAKSLVFHVAGTGNQGYTNARSVRVSKANVSLALGKTAKIKAKTVKQSVLKKLFPVKHVAAYRYYSTDEKVASVSGKGIIQGKGRGICTVYVVAANGVKKGIRVTVK